MRMSGLRVVTLAAEHWVCRVTRSTRWTCTCAGRQEQRRFGRSDAAHVARQFDFFERVAGARLGADRVSPSGHTADDQAETFLLRLLRGAGTRGLSSIYPRHGLVIRPLLDLSRHSLRDFLGAQKIAFRDDASNDDLSIPRNRVRHELLPYLRQRFSSGITGVLAREAELAREDADWLDAAANQVAGRVVVVQEDAVEIVPGGLEGVAAPLVRRIVRGALGTFADGRFIGFDHVEALLGMVRNREGDVLSLPGQRAVRAGDRIQLTPATADAPPPPVAFSYALPVPGAADVVEAGVVITAERGDAPDQGELSARAECVAIDAAGVAEPLTVRPRQAGDKIRPLGAPGRRLLQDVFVDRKIPRAVRARVPIVTDSQGHIVWVVGQTIAEEFRITGATQSVIILKARQLGGAG